jgi:tyrosinase
MLNIWSSTNDPLFFLHHANLDRIWYIWQKRHNIIYDIGGPLWANGTGVTTFDTFLDMGVFLAPPIPARKVMDTLNRDDTGILCYEYVGDVLKTIK